MNMKKISITLCLVLTMIFLLTPVGISIQSHSLQSHTIKVNMMRDNYIDITVNEAWDLLSDTSNGVQIPIDVRTDSEWLTERIDTPYPEFPRQFEKDDIMDENKFQEFLELYDGNDIIVYCKSGGRSAASADVIVNRGFNGSVYNVLGGITDWKMKGHPTKSGNTDPGIPSIPTGSSICLIDEEYSFCTIASDADNDPLRYGWDFDNDGLVDKWTDFFQSSEEICISQQFTITGTYNITVRAQDNVGSNSAFSDPLEIYVNTPPDSPVITGDTEGKAGSSYEYEIQAIDEDGDQVSYLVDWGDDSTTEWSEFIDSGEIFITSHKWDEQGDFEIRVKTKDEFNAESDWATLQVSMPKQKDFISITFEFIQKILHVFPIFHL